MKENPFLGMGIKSIGDPGRGNVAATRAQYGLHRATAREMGRHSIATAAVLCFECCQRVYDAFDFVARMERREEGGLTGSPAADFAAE